MFAVPHCDVLLSRMVMFLITHHVAHRTCLLTVVCMSFHPTIACIVSGIFLWFPDNFRVCTSLVHSLCVYVPSSFTVFSSHNVHILVCGSLYVCLIRHSHNPSVVCCFHACVALYCLSLLDFGFSRSLILEPLPIRESCEPTTSP